MTYIIEMEEDILQTVYNRILAEESVYNGKRLDNSEFCELIKVFTELGENLVNHKIACNEECINDEEL